MTAVTNPAEGQNGATPSGGPAKPAAITRVLRDVHRLDARDWSFFPLPFL